jgi:hypothetical protein
MRYNGALFFGFLALWLIPERLFSQNLNPNFEATELYEMLLISSRTCMLDSDYIQGIPEPQFHHLAYSSPVMAMDNQWQLWTAENQIPVISLRGSTLKAESWISNIYAAMVPATGYLLLSATDTFHYQLADNQRAAVHVGWLLSMAYLSRDILPRIDSMYAMGHRSFLITGHSQGGALSYLLTAYLMQLQKKGRLPADLQFKTYCTAAPKPGNLYFALDYEYATQKTGSFNAVNALDWVPETPVSIQTLTDFQIVSPLYQAKPLIKKQKFGRRLAMNYMYRRLSKPTLKAQRRYERYMGKRVSKMVQDYLPDYVEPTYFPSMAYVRVGNPIVLFPSNLYYQKFEPNSKDLFINHLHKAYSFLAWEAKK